MNEQLKSLSKIFTETLLRIPDYQRGYAWGEREVKDFWEDIQRLSEDRKHYLGVLTLEKVEESTYKKWLDDEWLIKSQNFVPFYVVDGQQRITTSIILISEIVKLMRQKQIQLINYMTAEMIESKFILMKQPNSDKNVSYLFSYERDNPGYSYLNRLLNEDSSQRKMIENETIYTKNLEGASLFFRKELSSLSATDIEILFKKITQNFMINVYQIAPDIDIHVAFESMNNRGKQLTTLERLKNRLIYLTILLKIEKSKQKKLRRDINECWKEVYHRLGMKKTDAMDDDEFLRANNYVYFSNVHYQEDKRKYIHSFGYKRSDKVLETYFTPEKILSNEITESDIEKYIDNMEKTVANWSSLLNPDTSNFSDEIKHYLKLINFLENEMYYRSSSPDFLLILAVINSKPHTNLLLEFLKKFEKLSFLYFFYTEIDYLVYDSEVSIDYVEMMSKLQNKEIDVPGIIQKISEQIKFILNSPLAHNKLIGHYRKEGFYKPVLLSYILYNYEHYLLTKSETHNERILISNLKLRGYYYDNKEKMITIEHIYPQKSKNQYWKDMFEELHSHHKNKFKQSLGNFVLLSQSKNIKLANKGFEEKRDAPNGCGYKMGSYAEVLLCDYKKWGPDEILNRGLELTNFLNDRWEIKFKNKTEKIEFLGLDFLNERKNNKK